MNPNRLLFKILLFLAFHWIFVFGIADRAAYYINNVFDGLCITGGPVIDQNTVSLFKSGVLESSNCSSTFNQQWVIKATGISHRFTQYELRSFNSKDINKLLDAKILGEFIQYFPNPLEFRPQVKETYDKIEYVLYDPKINSCYESMGDNHVLHLSSCNSSSKSQLWMLTLVNEPVAPGINCTSFWACNT